ncbi:MAG: hypothetical protein AB1791_12560 [Chloroflexota bacterium]
MQIAIVGPSASGKSTLVAALRAAGYDARHVAQEHSYVPALWRRITRPDVLIYLDANDQTVRARRPHSLETPHWLDDERRRLAHARAHCDLYLPTDYLSPAQVQEKVLDFLQTVTTPEQTPSRY